MAEKQDARKWLRANGYEDVADLIDEIMEEWRESNNTTRRNWWDILAGDKHGKARTVAGRKFPVLRAAQRRQGRPVTDNAICRNEDEAPQAIWDVKRWDGHVRTSEKGGENASGNRENRGQQPVFDKSVGRPKGSKDKVKRKAPKPKRPLSETRKRRE